MNIKISEKELLEMIDLSEEINKFTKRMKIGEISNFRRGKI
ncbi:MAG: hypothetical protein N2380_03475 [bacterium]|nr:hypothetical protein [bacterium]